MIGFSCPPMCMMPFREAARMVEPHFSLWELVSEAEHFLPDIGEDVREFLDIKDQGKFVGQIH